MPIRAAVQHVLKHLIMVKHHHSRTYFCNYRCHCNYFITPVLPYALAFAAGAMIFVVVEELIPDSQSSNNTDLATLSLMLGFMIMMILDVSLG